MPLSENEATESLLADILRGAGVTPDSIWHVQAATNLLQWAEIGTVQAAGDGTITFTDTNTLQYPMRFYRLSGN